MKPKPVRVGHLELVLKEEAHLSRPFVWWMSRWVLRFHWILDV